MADFVVHEQLALAIYGCLHSCVIKAAIGFEGPFNLKMLSSNLGLGTDTYGLSFIVRDLLDGHFITKSGDLYTARPFENDKIEYATALIEEHKQSTLSNMLPEQLLYWAYRSPLPPHGKKTLIDGLLKGMWKNPQLLLEAIAVYGLNSDFKDGDYLTRSEFEECVENSQNPLCAGKLLVHLASERITAIPRKQVPKCCVQFEYRLGKLLLAYSESVTFDKTADQFLHAVLRTRLDVHRLAMTVEHEMPYEKLSKQLDEKGEGTSNDVVGPIIDEPIPERVRRLDIKGKLNPELWILSVYMILELISIKSVPFLVNHMLAFEDKQCSWAYCSLVSREFGFIDKEGTFWIENGLASIIHHYLVSVCPDDPTTRCLVDGLTNSPDCLAKTLLSR